MTVLNKDNVTHYLRLADACLRLSCQRHVQANGNFSVIFVLCHGLITIRKIYLYVVAG